MADEDEMLFEEVGGVLDAQAREHILLVVADRHRLEVDQRSHVVIVLDRLGWRQFTTKLQAHIHI